MKLKINIVDAFAQERFKGNSAAVIISTEWMSADLMQAIAMENNLSETAFLVKGDDGSYAIRWFSPFTEIDFCGHATLAAASIIFKENPELGSVTLYAKAVGRMAVERLDDGSIQMDFPNRKPLPVKNVPKDLLQGLSIAPTRVLRNDQAYFAVYDKEADVLNVEQSKEHLVALAPYDVVVTANGIDYDFVSRYFWPANGGDEDPVTGSIHTGLAPYWAELLGKNHLVAYQASQRGGVLSCRVTDQRVFISGKAVQYLEGYIEV